MDSACTNAASNPTAIEAALASISPAHRNLMKRRELAETYGLFSLHSKLIECPTCGADVPDHAYQYHVSFHPVCPGCRTAFISDFVLEIHRAIDCTDSRDKPKSRGKRKLASTPTVKAQIESKKGGKKNNANNKKTNANSKTNASPVQIAVSQGGFPTSSLSVPQDACDTNLTGVSDSHQVSNIVSNQSDVLSVSSASEPFQSYAATNIPGTQNDVASVPNTSDSVHAATKIPGLAKYDDDLKDTAQDKNSSSSEREEERISVVNGVCSVGAMRRNGLEEMSEFVEVENASRMEVESAGLNGFSVAEEDPIFGLGDAKYQQQKKCWRIRAEQMRRGRETKYFRELQRVLGIPFVATDRPCSGYNEMNDDDKRPSVSRSKLLKRANEVISLLKSKEESLLREKTAESEKKISLENIVKDLLNSTPATKTSATVPTTAPTKASAAAPVKAITKTSSKTPTTADMWKRAASVMDGGSESHWIIDAKPSTKLSAVASRSPSAALYVDVENAFESTDQVGVMSVDVEDADVEPKDGQLTDQADASSVGVDDELCLNEGEDLDIEVDDKLDESVDLIIEVDDAYLEGLNDAEFINDSIGDDASPS